MSESSVDNISAKLNIKFEDAPPFGGGAMPAEKEKTFVMLAHLFSWIVWLIKRKESPAVDAHGKEATNFAITIAIFYVPLILVISLLSFLPGFLLTIISLLLAVVALGLLGLVIIGMIKAKEGKLMRYPINFRLIK
ncbi:MAG TPA: DUF4870 domain-containing protein [Verrucomicrobiales bacterium]|nr:DUF4870 domain-containing protein [Verrucomicrobiales bacterium]